MQNNKKDTFFIADLCLVTDVIELPTSHGRIKYYYKPIDTKIIYHKNKKYYDIDTNENYKTTCKEIGDKFIKEPITPFSTFLKSHRIEYNKTDIRNKKRVKELYSENKSRH